MHLNNYRLQLLLQAAKNCLFNLITWCFLTILWNKKQFIWWCKLEYVLQETYILFQSFYFKIYIFILCCRILSDCNIETWTFCEAALKQELWKALYKYELEVNQLQPFIKHRDWVYTVGTHMRDLRGSICAAPEGNRPDSCSDGFRSDPHTAGHTCPTDYSHHNLQRRAQNTERVDAKSPVWLNMSNYLLSPIKGFTNAWAAVVSADHVSWRTGTGSSFGRGETVMLTAQRCTAPDTWHKTQPYSTRNVRKHLVKPNTSILADWHHNKW